MGISVGEVVKSKAGRDAGRYFVIKEIIDDKFVLIVDGDLRKLEKPKKKKIKHLEMTGDVLVELVPWLQDNGRRITNKDITKSIINYLNKKVIENNDANAE